MAVKYAKYKEHLQSKGIPQYDSIESILNDRGAHSIYALSEHLKKKSEVNSTS